MIIAHANMIFKKDCLKAAFSLYLLHIFQPEMFVSKFWVICTTSCVFFDLFRTKITFNGLFFFNLFDFIRRKSIVVKNASKIWWYFLLSEQLLHVLVVELAKTLLCDFGTDETEEQCEDVLCPQLLESVSLDMPLLESLVCGAVCKE